jgi:hypothetical protein
MFYKGNPLILNIYYAFVDSFIFYIRYTLCLLALDTIEVQFQASIIFSMQFITLFANVLPRQRIDLVQC